MKTLELNQMENVQGGFNWEGCAVSGLMTAIQFSGFGPWGFIGGAALGCGVAQL